VEPDNTPRRGFAAALALVDATHSAWQATQAGARADDPVDLPLDLAPDAEAAQAALHDDRLWQLARRGQGTVMSLEFELQTRLARQAFRRDFAYVSRQLLGLEASRRVQGLDRTALDDALRNVRERGDELQARFARMAAELDALPVPSRAAATAFGPAAPARLRATVLSPHARRFVELLQAVDQVVWRVERAWLLGLLSPARRTALVGECRRGLVGFKELVRARRQAIGARVREVNARPDGEAGQPPA
jgi:hypothetical protein